jgi:hypothetical protein
MSCAISSVDIPARRRFSTSSSRQTSPLLSNAHLPLNADCTLFIPAKSLAFPEAGDRIPS